jgi:hypothetical protein
VTAFFDWDGNGLYETAANIGTVGGEACAQSVSQQVTVPLDALPGTFHMRVVLNASGFAE